MSVLHVAEEDVVEHCDGVDVENSILQWNEEEVDELRWRPYEPVGDVDGEEFLAKDIVSFTYRFTGEEEGCVEVMNDEYWAHYHLKERKFLISNPAWT